MLIRKYYHLYKQIDFCIFFMYTCDILHAQCSSYTQSSRNISFQILDEADDPLEELDLLIQESSTKLKTSACHCNCHFKNLLYTLTQLFKFYPQTFFIYPKNRSGIAPPIFQLHLMHNKRLCKADLNLDIKTRKIDDNYNQTITFKYCIT